MPKTHYRNPDAASAQWLWDCLVEWHSTEYQSIRDYLTTWIAHGIDPVMERTPTVLVEDLLLQLLKHPVVTVRHSAIVASLPHASSAGIRHALQDLVRLDPTTEGKFQAEQTLRAMRFYFAQDSDYRAWESPEIRYARIGGTQAAWVSSWLGEDWGTQPTSVQAGSNVTVK